MQFVSAFEGGHDHLAEDGLLLLEFGQLFLEVGVFLLLVDHAQLQRAVQGLDQGRGGFGYLLVDVFDLGAHGLQLLPEELD